MTGTILPFDGTAPTISDTAFIAESAVVIGDTHIGAGSSIWYNCVVRGDVHRIRIGERTNVQDGTVVHVSKGTAPTHIGNDVTIGHMCLIHGCTLEDGCFIGMNATVMDGAVVESGAMVAAGALVTPGKRIPAGQLWGGYPARYMRDVGEKDLVMIREIAPHYAELAAKYLKERRG